MNIASLYKKLSESEMDKVAEIIQTIGIGVSVGTLNHRESFKKEMFMHGGNVRVIFKYLSRLSESEQKKFYDAIIASNG